MSDLAIFIVGLLLTLAIGGAMAFLIWAAIQDGKTQRASAVRIQADAGRAPTAAAQPLPRRGSELPTPEPR